MQLSTLLVILGIGILVAAFILFPGLWSLFKGFGKLFIKDMATTPEGARAIYEEQIDESISDGISISKCFDSLWWRRNE